MQIRALILIAILALSISVKAQNTHSKVLKLMGSRYEITAVHEDPVLAWESINAAITEIERIEKLISSWDPSSQTSLINRMAGREAVKVDKELFDLISRSLKVSGLTEGAFDISFASMDNIWKFDGSMQEMPDPETVVRAASLINYKDIILDREAQTVLLRKEGMKIGFGAIGKGYAANRAKVLMSSKGIKGGLVNAGGDLTAWGLQENGKNWKIGISDPVDKDHIACWLTVENGAIVTSGDYERYVEFDGQRYAHIIDPRSGYPVTGLKSVTIICPDAELADALATSIFVIGAEKGVELINKLKGIECLLIDDKDEFIPSANLQIELEPRPEK